MRAVSTNSGVRSIPVTVGAGRGRHPRGAADPAAHVEQSYAGRDAEAVEDMLARRRTSSVQLVDREQVVGPQLIGVDPGTGQGSKDGRGEIVVGP